MVKVKGNEKEIHVLRKDFDAFQKKITKDIEKIVETLGQLTEILKKKK